MGRRELGFQNTLVHEFKCQKAGETAPLMTFDLFAVPYSCDIYWQCLISGPTPRNMLLAIPGRIQSSSCGGLAMETGGNQILTFLDESGFSRKTFSKDCPRDRSSSLSSEPW